MLTPMDIDQKVFRKSMRGYNVDDVESFLMEICESYEELYMEHQEAKEQIALLSDGIAQYKAMEETLKNGLAVAERDSAELKRAAQEEVETLLREGKKKVEEETSQLSYQYEQMKQSVEIFRAKVVSLLHAQLDVIKEYGEETGEPLPESVPEVQMDCTEELPDLPELPLAEQDTVEIPPIFMQNDTEE